MCAVDSFCSFFERWRFKDNERDDWDDDEVRVLLFCNFSFFFFMERRRDGRTVKLLLVDEADTTVAEDDVWMLHFFSFVIDDFLAESVMICERERL